MSEPIFDIPGGPRATAMTIEELKRKVFEYAVSGEWWIILPNLEALLWLQGIEERYYPGDANNDYELVILPPGMIPVPPGSEPLICVVMAKKCRLPREVLQIELEEREAATGQIPQEQSLMVFWGGVNTALAIGKAFQAWLATAKPAEEVSTT